MNFKILLAVILLLGLASTTATTGGVGGGGGSSGAGGLAGNAADLIPIVGAGAATFLWSVLAIKAPTVIVSALVIPVGVVPAALVTGAIALLSLQNRLENAAKKQ